MNARSGDLSPLSFRSWRPNHEAASRTDIFSTLVHDNSRSSSSKTKLSKSNTVSSMIFFVFSGIDQLSGQFRVWFFAS